MKDIFFNNFKTVVIDFNDYFEKNDIRISNKQNTKFEFPILNINKTFSFLDQYKLNKEYIENFKVSTGSTPFSISEELYGTENLWWLILYLNKFNGFDFIMDNNEIKQLADILFEKEKNYSNVETYFDLLFELNEDKRNLIVFKKEKIQSIIREIARKTL
jgi:hypothetical protein